MIKEEDINIAEVIARRYRSAVDDAEKRKQELSVVQNEPEGETVAEMEAHNARMKAYVDAVGECADAWEIYTKALDLQNVLMEKYNAQLRKRISEIEAKRGLRK